MYTDKELLLKGLRYIAITITLMFTAPVIVYQSFKNQDHMWFWLVCIIGIILGISAIAMGFCSIKIIMNSLFTNKKNIDIKQKK